MGSLGPFGAGRVLDEPVTARKCEKASEQPHKSGRTEGVGRRPDRVRRTWHGLRGLRSGSSRAGRSDLPMQCDGVLAGLVTTLAPLGVVVSKFLVDFVQLLPVPLLPLVYACMNGCR